MDAFIVFSKRQMHNLKEASDTIEKEDEKISKLKASKYTKKDDDKISKLNNLIDEGKMLLRNALKARTGFDCFKKEN